MSPSQPDLFSGLDTGGGTAVTRTAMTMEPPPPDFVHRIRRELQATLRVVQGAQALPWNLTEATLAELRFNSIAGWLPPEEAQQLRAAFDAELTRLYLIADELGEAAGQ